MRGEAAARLEKELPSTCCKIKNLPALYPFADYAVGTAYRYALGIQIKLAIGSGISERPKHLARDSTLR